MTRDALLSSTFAQRHIGPRADDVAHMLSVIGVDSVDELITKAVPEGIRATEALDLPAARSEPAVVDRLRELAGRNQIMRSFIGLGYHGTHTPGVIQRNILEDPSWYTAYTPYQPEISQGRLEALLAFQTMVTDLTGMEIANSSLLDEGTAAAEAMTMTLRMQRRANGDVFVVAPDVHPQTLAVVATRAKPLGIEIVVADPFTDELPAETFAVLAQYPGSTGEVRDLAPMVERVQAMGAKVVVAADLLALTLLTPPGEAGVDAVVGTSQRFGVPMMYGGPHAAFLAAGEDAKRVMPGRIVGVSRDTEERLALRLALQTREQHIRREKATSNICTAQVLLAVIAAMYAAYHGPEGLTAIARRTHEHAGRLAAGLRAAGVELAHDSFFDTVTAIVPGAADAVCAAALTRGINLRRVDDDRVGVSFDETTTSEDVADVLACIVAPSGGVDADAGELAPVDGIPAGLWRTSEFMTARVFHAFRSETAMLRELRRLSDRDLALDRTMIPLGSCTMKLNATTEMVAVTWPEFASLHPFAPVEQAAGTRELIGELEDMLAEITGYDAVSLQPNAGSQGEFAGLLAIRSFHDANGDQHRTACLIPESAHGTNAASAVMAGMQVVVVDCDEQGNVDVDDLKRKAVEHADTLAALMVTYPSTHGVFETRIVEICDLVHEFGGQVYLDGANLNALVGVAEPGEFGSDVSHLNLHKTFCIPHGGGGPGVGPIGVRSHLAPYLPNHPLVPEAGPETGPGPISAAPWGSAGILQISWAYIALMGPKGLTDATHTAILNANYIAKRLDEHYPVLYAGEAGLVAHEAIVDLRHLKTQAGISNEDVAKRLIDYGFHAPTMSFPVAGTLMIEPTESESLEEIDRFCDAMIAIRHEIAKVADGGWPADDNPLVHAPHTAEDLLGATWERAYTREEAAFPVPALRQDKYWPPVSRIDGVFGDRNLVCDCAPLDAYRDA